MPHWCRVSLRNGWPWIGELLLEATLLVVGVDGGNLAGQRAAIHRAVLLGERHRVALAGGFHCGTGGQIAAGGRA